MITQYLDTFSGFLRKLYSVNTFIGGSHALLLHGLDFRTPEDFDFIIYHPHQYQMDLILNSDLAGNPIESNDDSYKREDETPDGLPRRSYRFLKDGLTLNILIKTNLEPPTQPLVLFHGDYSWAVGSIDRIVAAKGRYGRQKDHDDMQILKQNFDI